MYVCATYTTVCVHTYVRAILLLHCSYSNTLVCYIVHACCICLRVYILMWVGLINIIIFLYSNQFKTCDA